MKNGCSSRKIALISLYAASRMGRTGAGPPSLFDMQSLPRANVFQKHWSLSQPPTVTACHSPRASRRHRPSWRLVSMKQTNEKKNRTTKEKEQKQKQKQGVNS